jgi:hypothetical protein
LPYLRTQAREAYSDGGDGRGLYWPSCISLPALHGDLDAQGEGGGSEAGAGGKGGEVSYDFMPSLDVLFTKAPAIAIAGPSGCGKTESAMRLARGYCGPGVPFAVIDTEEKRALYKQKRYQPWDWVDFQPPFSPENCVEILRAAAKYKAVIFDSGSSEYDGDGGISDIQEESLERMAKGDVKRMEALSGPAWKEAKRRHKRVFMNYLRRYPTLLIVCLRAEPKVKFIKVEGRTQIVDAGYQPICEKQFMYDMLVGCKMTPGEAGIPEHIKKLEKELEPIFLDGKQIDEQTGERLAVWTNLRAASYPAGGKKLDANPGVQQDEKAGDYITADQATALEVRCNEHDIKPERLKLAAKVERFAQIKVADYDRCVAWLDKAIAAKAAA